MKTNLNKYVYVICRVDPKYFSRISRDLKERGYKNIRPIIPTIDRLVKSKKGHDVVNTVPMLFNYGFIRMKLVRSLDRQFLKQLTKDIMGITTFVKAPETMHRKKIKNRVDNPADWDDFTIAATISPREARRLLQLSKKNQVYSNDDIVKLRLGEYITLRGYPYEGLGAMVLDINLTNRMVRVELISTMESRIVISLAFEHCLYSVYDEFDADKVTANPEEVDLSSIPDTYES